MKKCETPKYMSVELCEGCKRATNSSTDNTATYTPKKNGIVWTCIRLMIKDEHMAFATKIKKDFDDNGLSPYQISIKYSIGLDIILAILEEK